MPISAAKVVSFESRRLYFHGLITGILTSFFVIYCLQSSKKEPFTSVNLSCNLPNNLTWSSLKGLNNEINNIHEIIQNIKEKETGIHIIGLYGPPGTGKTSLAMLIGKELNTAKFMHVQQNNVYDRFFGGSERNIDSLFTKAFSLSDSGQFVVLFIDEADSLLENRDSYDNEMFVTRSIVNQFLTKLDECSNKKNLLVILSTNFIQKIDRAVCDRVSIWFKIPLPPHSVLIEIANEILEGMTTNEEKETTRRHVSGRIRSNDVDLSPSDITNILKESYKQSQMCKTIEELNTNGLAPLNLQLFDSVFNDVVLTKRLQNGMNMRARYQNLRSLLQNLNIPNQRTQSSPATTPSTDFYDSFNDVHQSFS